MAILGLRLTAASAVRVGTANPFVRECSRPSATRWTTDQELDLSRPHVAIGPPFNGALTVGV
jgi:hypothetical protein